MALKVLFFDNSDSVKDKSASLEFELLSIFIKDVFYEEIPSELGRLGECSKSLPIGSYSLIHALRGFAIAIEFHYPGLKNLSQKDFDLISQEFYQNGRSTTHFPHLINHPDDSGFYIPYPLTKPKLIQTEYENKTVSTAIGSSYALLSELEVIQNFMESGLDDECIKSLQGLRETLHRLMLCAQTSINQKLVIEFI